MRRSSPQREPTQDSEPVRALYGLAGVADLCNTGVGRIDPRDITRVDINYIEHIAPLPGDGRISFHPASSSSLHWIPSCTRFESDLRFAPVFVPLQINELRIYDGALEGLPPDLGANAAYASLARLESPSPGPHTLINIGDETVDLYFLVVKPYPDTDTATPPA